MIEYNATTRKSRLFRLGVSLSQMLNVLVLDGHEDHTTSGHVGFLANTRPYKRRWRYAKVFINGIFFWEDDHCEDSIEYDKLRRYGVDV